MHVCRRLSTEVVVVCDLRAVGCGVGSGTWLTVKRHICSPRSFYCVVACSFCMGPHGLTDLLYHRPPACLFSYPMACSLRGSLRESWLYLAVCFPGGSQHLCLPYSLCRYFLIPPLFPLWLCGRKGSPCIWVGKDHFVRSLAPLGLCWLEAEPARVLGGQGDLAHESSLDSSPAFLRGSRLPVAPALALSVWKSRIPEEAAAPRKWSWGQSRAWGGAGATDGDAAPGCTSPLQCSTAAAGPQVPLCPWYSGGWKGQIMELVIFSHVWTSPSFTLCQNPRREPWLRLR